MFSLPLGLIISFEREALKFYDSSPDFRHDIFTIFLRLIIYEYVKKNIQATEKSITTKSTATKHRNLWSMT